MQTIQPKTHKPLYYFSVKTTQRIGDNCQNILSHVVSSVSSDSRLIETMVAQNINHGAFDSDTFSIPCFEYDGHITYPESINKIDLMTFENLKMHMPELSIDEFDLELDSDSPIIEFIVHESSEI